MDHHHPLREALVKVFKRRVFLKQPAARNHGGAGADGSGDSKADDSDGSDCGDGPDAGDNDARLDDEAVAAADPALFTKVCAPRSGRFTLHQQACSAACPSGQSACVPGCLLQLARCLTAVRTCGTCRLGSCARCARASRQRMRPPRGSARRRRARSTALRASMPPWTLRCRHGTTQPKKNILCTGCPVVYSSKRNVNVCRVKLGDHGKQQYLTMVPMMHVCWSLAHTAAMQTVMRQVVLGDVRALQIVKAGRLNLLPATVTLPSSAIRYTVSSGPRTPGPDGEPSTGLAQVPGPLEAGLVFKQAALERLAARSTELQAEHVRKDVCGALLQLLGHCRSKSACNDAHCCSTTLW